ncbi:MAG: hypothetical protein EOP04_01685 [Proteobacteria bacterium]|nr:MAG: hypothetical protein EOP04_01685 [Pseudomonadota bacterium]
MLNRILLVVSFLWISSCKTTSASNTKSVVFTKNEQTFFVHYDKENFYINICQRNALNESALKIKKDPEKAKELCKDQSLLIPPQTLKTALIAKLSEPLTKKFFDSKTNRMEWLASAIARETTTLENLFSGGVGEEGAEVYDSKIASLSTSLEKLEKERKDLELALKTPEKLRELDINSTLDIRNKLFTTIDEAVDIFLAILMDTKIYNLTNDKDSLLISALTDFAPSCSNDAKVGETFEQNLGVEKIRYVCDASGNPKALKTECSLDGYERIDNFCIFTGRQLKLSQLVATGSGMCGLSKGKLTCWGNSSRYPMVNASGVGPAQIPEILGDKLVASDSQVCALDKNQKITGCWSSGIITPYSKNSLSTLSAGRNHICGVTAAGGLDCWGMENSAFLTTIKNFSDLKGIVSGSQTACAVGKSNSVDCWGSFQGFGATIDAAIPEDIKNPLAVTLGTTHGCAILADRSVKCWGSPNLANHPIPPRVATSRTVIAANGESCAISTSNELSCWGFPVFPDYTPGHDLSGVKHIYKDFEGTNLCATGENSGAWCWGRSKYYRGGYDITPPIQDRVVTTIAIGTSGYACAILGSGEISCWGNDKDITSAVPILLNRGS